MRRHPNLDPDAAPARILGVPDVVALVVGIVVGTGIFRAPSIVAANAGSETTAVLTWLIGGLVSMAGVLCYAELATTYPNAGGEFHFLTRAFGPKLGFLFAWARLTVIPTGSVAVMAFVFGDYVSQLFRIDGFSSAIYAVLVVVLLTGVNILGVRYGKRTQNLLTAMEVAGVLVVIVSGLLLVAPDTPTQVTLAAHRSGEASAPLSWHAAWGIMMIFVLLTYGGWNDAAYISAEVKGSRRNIAWALLIGLLTITALYVLINLAFVRGLGLERMAASEAVAADLMRAALGRPGAVVISTLIAIAALTSANATILMGARSNYALGRSYPLFAPLGRWNYEAGSPVNALLVQSAITLALVGMGVLARKGFETMVEYTAPVFWFFFLLTGLSLFVMRHREPNAERPFRVPLYPFTPIVFCATAAYLLYSSLAYTGIGALIGVCVLALGGFALWFGQRRKLLNDR
jgi:APA family basic amino acid/polyamine antiporter